MKKLQMSDLTPAMLTEVRKLADPKKIVEFFASKDFEVSEEAAQKMLDKLNAGEGKLDDDVLDKVAGGCENQGYPHTSS